MASTVVLHIGPQKTGTTSAQLWLASNRDHLDAQGAAYPLPHGQFNHGYAAADLLRTDPRAMSALPEVSRRGLARSKHRTQGAWARLVEDVRSTEARVIISCESFSLLSAEVAQQALHDLANGGETDVTVVATIRPVSELIPSYYQEMEKKQLSGGFASELDRYLQLLSLEGLTEVSWMRPGFLRDAWTTRSTQFCSVDPRPTIRSASDAVRYRSTLWSALGIRAPEEVPRSNTSLSLVGLIAWRIFLKRHGGVAGPVGAQCRDLAYRARPIATDARSGGAIRLAERLATIVDDIVTDREEPLPHRSLLPEVDNGGVALAVPTDVDIRGTASALVRDMRRAAPRALAAAAARVVKGGYGNGLALLKDQAPSLVRLGPPEARDAASPLIASRG